MVPIEAVQPHGVFDRLPLRRHLLPLVDVDDRPLPPRDAVVLKVTRRQAEQLGVVLHDEVRVGARSLLRQQQPREGGQQIEETYGRYGGTAVRYSRHGGTTVCGGVQQWRENPRNLLQSWKLVSKERCGTAVRCRAHTRKKIFTRVYSTYVQQTEGSLTITHLQGIARAVSVERAGGIDGPGEVQPVAAAAAAAAVAAAAVVAVKVSHVSGQVLAAVAGLYGAGAGVVEVHSLGAYLGLFVLVVVPHGGLGDAHARQLNKGLFSGGTGGRGGVPGLSLNPCAAPAVVGWVGPVCHASA